MNVIEYNTTEPLTALDFELIAIESGLKTGFNNDFQWVESTDERKCCLLCSDAATSFAEGLGLEKELSPSGLYILYFLS